MYFLFRKWQVRSKNCLNIICAFSHIFFPPFSEIFSRTILFRHFASRTEKRKMSRAPKRLLHGDPQLWTTALPSMTGIWCFSSFYLWIIKLLYLFLHLLIQIWSQNHKCNVLNVFLSFLAIIIRGQRTVFYDRSPNWVRYTVKHFLGKIPQNVSNAN